MPDDVTETPVETPAETPAADAPPPPPLEDAGDAPQLGGEVTSPADAPLPVEEAPAPPPPPPPPSALRVQHAVTGKVVAWWTKWLSVSRGDGPVLSEEMRERFAADVVEGLSGYPFEGEEAEVLLRTDANGTPDAGGLLEWAARRAEIPPGYLPRGFAMRVRYNEVTIT